MTQGRLYYTLWWTATNMLLLFKFAVKASEFGNLGLKMVNIQIAIKQ